MYSSYSDIQLGTLFYNFRSSDCCDSCSSYYRGAVTITPVTAAIVAIVISITLLKTTVGVLRFDASDKGEALFNSLTICNNLIFYILNK